MAYKIRADLKAMQQVTVQGKSTGLGVLGNNMTYYPTNSNGECTFPLLPKMKLTLLSMDYHLHNTENCMMTLV